MAALAICLPFYCNAGMLAHQYAVWADYPEAVKAQIEIVLVDDGSPVPAIRVPRPDGLPALRIYRVLEDMPWHQHGARNLAAKVAQSPWLFLSDMDHVLPAKSAARLLSLRDDAVYTFHRLDAPDLRPKLHGRKFHPHPNTYAVTKDRLWALGGYDEDLKGYGTDWAFRAKLQPFTRHLPDVAVIRYPREVIRDASTQCEGDPKAFRDKARKTAECRRIVAEKAAKRQPPKTLDFDWERVL